MPTVIYDQECALGRSDTDSISSEEEDKQDPNEYTKLQETEAELSTSRERQSSNPFWNTPYGLIGIRFGFLTLWVSLLTFIWVVLALLCKAYRGSNAGVDVEPISLDKLVNITELNLQTGFQIESGKQRMREYEFNITHGWAAPSGVRKKMVLVNGQSPGPLIEVNTGDTVRVRVNNHLPDESTTIHWHGIHQRNTTWMDGVAGISQCGIPPGKSFTYEYQIIDQRGTFWYHAHSKVQYTDGLYGPIVVHDPDERLPPDTEMTDERIIFMGGSFHAYGEDLLEIHHPHDHTNPLQNHAIRLRLINHSSFTSLYFTIDSHPELTIIEIDGVEVTPITVPGVYINIGQRYSILVTPLPTTTGSFIMRATLPKSCFLPYVPYSSSILESVNYQGTALLSYSPSLPNNNTTTTITPHNPNNITIPKKCTDLPFSLPIPLRPIPAYPLDDAHPSKNTHEINFQFQQAGPVNRIFINRTSYSPLPTTAQLWLSLSQSFTGDAGGYNNWNFPLNQQVLLLPDPNKTVQIVINSRDIMEHPFHLHGHTFQIVAWGPGEFNAGGSNPNTTWNLQNPMRRDTLTIPGLSHVVIRFLADNPGIWALHCHVAWHMEAGMLVTFLERPEDLKRLVHDMDPSTRELSRSFCADEGVDTNNIKENTELSRSN
ncbi:multicopper oxidase-domain-containing protein [Apiosordaria backusii]|uniref:Multicopper oxidase-domain-containing protein n=1 Tax=Apiosordaria backusii TaxID=314023 RepID=A0AA40ETI5_9PEZI|nr:multicopper oxidase-domain-containing protein [Apiosordaria backusii]